jgi:hypothetical protein
MFLPGAIFRSGFFMGGELFVSFLGISVRLLMQGFVAKCLHPIPGSDGKNKKIITAQLFCPSKPHFCRFSGPGVGKGRQIAGIVFENYILKRRSK